VELAAHRLDAAAGAVVVGLEDLLDRQALGIGGEEVGRVCGVPEDAVGGERRDHALELAGGQVETLCQRLVGDDRLAAREAAGDQGHRRQPHPARLERRLVVEIARQDGEVLGGVRGLAPQEHDRPGELDRHHEEEDEGEAAVDDVDVAEKLDVVGEALAQQLQEDGGREAAHQGMVRPTAVATKGRTVRSTFSWRSRRSPGLWRRMMRLEKVAPTSSGPQNSNRVKESMRTRSGRRRETAQILLIASSMVAKAKRAVAKKVIMPKPWMVPAWSRNSRSLSTTVWSE